MQKMLRRPKNMRSVSFNNTGIKEAHKKSFLKTIENTDKIVSLHNIHIINNFKEVHLLSKFGERSLFFSTCVFFHEHSRFTEHQRGEKLLL